MGKESSSSSSDEVEFVKAELSIHMHCQACEKEVVYALFKSKGVESVKSSFGTQKVVVAGKIDLPALVKRIERKTRKKVVATVIKDDADGAAVPAPVPGCSCHFCRPPIHHGYFVPGYSITGNGMGMNYAMPILENNYPSCSIM